MHLIEKVDIFWDEQSKQYIVSVDFSSGIFILDSALGVIKVLDMPLNPPGSANTEASVWKTLKDGSGRLWALGDIFSVMPEKEEKFIPAYKEFSHLPFLKRRFDDCAVDDKNNLLLLSGHKIYIIYHDDLHADSIELNKDLLSANLGIEVKMFFDKKRKLLYASGAKAIYQYDPASRKFRYLVYDMSKKNSLPQDLIAAYALDGLGNIWVSSAQFGIRVYEPTRLELIQELNPENSGLPPNAELKNGGENLMLIASNSGLFVYDITRNSFIKLTRENGMKNNLSWGYSIANNTLFLGMRDTIQYVSIETLNTMRKTIIPYISGVKVSGYPLRSDMLTEHLQFIKLNHRQRTISIEFSSFEFEFPERIRYAYRLDGLDENWNFTDNFNRTITYSKPL
jgi:hypothetical protein